MKWRSACVIFSFFSFLFSFLFAFCGHGDFGLFRRGARCGAKGTRQWASVPVTVLYGPHELPAGKKRKQRNEVVKKKKKKKKERKKESEGKMLDAYYTQFLWETDLER